MTDLAKTAAFVIAAAGLAGMAYVTRPASREIASISDQGQPLTPMLVSADTVKSVEVVSFDAAVAKTRAFKVAFDGKRWTIPSHNNYPADATDKVAAAAAAFIDLKKERIIGEDKNTLAQFGLLSPDDENLGAKPGEIGTRITMADASGKTVCDLIVGKAASSTATTPFESTQNKKYVRENGKNRVFVTTIASGFSTKFVDWVQTDLLKTTAAQITAINVDRYKIDETQGTLVDRQTIALSKPDAEEVEGNPADRKWTMNASPGGPPTPAEGLLSEQKVTDIVKTLTGLKIIGVRPKPTNLAKMLSGGEASVALNALDQINLQSRGFFITPEGRLLANTGQMSVRCEDGVYYSLWLGEVVPDGEDAASGGRVGGEAEKKDPATPESPKTDGAKPTDARYLMITVSFDPKIVAEPKKPAVLNNLPTPIAPRAEGTPTDESDDDFESGEVLSARQGYEAALEEYKSRKDSGKKRADELAKRFADWYYVIDGASVAKLRPTRADLLAPIPAATPPANNPPIPSLPPQDPGQ